MEEKEKEEKSLVEELAERRFVTHEQVLNQPDESVLETIPGFQKNVIFHLAALGFSYKEISKQLQIHTDRVKSILKGTLAKREIARLQQELYQRDHVRVFQYMAPKIAKDFYRIARDKAAKNSDRIAAGKEIMDRAWGKPKQVIQGETGGIADIYKQLDEINRRIREKEIAVESFDVLSNPRENGSENETVIEAPELDDVDALLAGKTK